MTIISDDDHGRAGSTDIDYAGTFNGDWGAATIKGLAGTKLGDRYEVLDVIAYGGMGIIYRGRHILLDKIVSIKVLNANYIQEPAALERFQYEAKVACRLSHPNIVTVHDFGVTDDRMPYLVMDCVEGKTLGQTLDQKSYLAPEHALEVMSQVCQGLEHAHQQGLIHRDLKPSNIMIASELDGRNCAKILDFGLAKLLGEEKRQGLSQTGFVIGTVFYMSPEQCRGKQADVRSDVYAVGCVLYEALTGTPPFVGDNLLETCRKHIEEMPLPMLEVNPEANTPAALEILVKRALEKNPDARFQSAADLRFAMEQLGDQLRERLKDNSASGSAAIASGDTNTGTVLPAMLAAIDLPGPSSPNIGASTSADAGSKARASSANTGANSQTLASSGRGASDRQGPISEAELYAADLSSEGLSEPKPSARYVLVQIILPLAALVLVGACAAIYFANGTAIRESLFAQLEGANGAAVSTGIPPKAIRSWPQLFHEAETAFEEQRYIAAEKLLQRAIARARNSNNDSQMLLALRKMEDVLYVQRKFQEADDLNIEIQRLAAAVAAPSATSSSSSSSEPLKGAAAMARTGKAMRELQTVIVQSNEPQDDRIADLAIMCHKHGQCDTAVSLLQHSVEISKKVYGAQSLKTASRLTELASLYMALDQPNKAQPLFNEVMKIRAVNGGKK
jgi:serine/threonine protein kinase